MRRDYDAYKAEQTTAHSKLQQQIQDSERIKGDYEALQALLDENPEIVAQLEEQLRRGTGTGRARGPAQPAQMAIPAELKSTMGEMQKFLRQQTTDRANAERRAEDQRTAQELNGEIAKFLTAKNYDQKYLPSARQFVIDRIREMVARQEDPNIEDVPVLLAQWYRDMEGFYNDRVARMRDGRQADTALPASPGPTPGQVVPRENDPGANDEKTSALLLAALKERGWT
jgi:hypothetical protein